MSEQSFPQGNVAHSTDTSSMSDSSDSIRERAKEMAGSSDTLIVVSKVKKLIRDVAGLNTSECAVNALTERIIEECLRATDRAKTSGRKTCMGRDFANS